MRDLCVNVERYGEFLVGPIVGKEALDGYNEV